MAGKQAGLKEVRLKTPVGAEDLTALGLGDVVFIDGLICTGREGVYRKVVDEGAPLPFDYPSAAYLMMGLNGIFATLAAIGGVMFVVVVVRSVFFGRKLAEDEKPQYPEVPPQAATVGHYGSAEKLHIPGTVVLVGVFFTAFVLYYFVNWKYLSEIWPLS